MTTYVGGDSWSPLDQADIDELKRLAGFKFWGFYVGGADLYLNTPWPLAAVHLLYTNEISPLPIWVPRQNCSEDPEQQAEQAIAACRASGVYGLVAVDSEHSMAAVPNYQSWLDRFAAAVGSHGWHCVTYAGAHYVAAGSFAWQVAWGQQELEPTAAECLQTGPYNLTTGKHVDADHCDTSFPFASWTESNPVVIPTPNPPNTQGEFNMQMPVLSETNPGPNVVSEPARSLQSLLNLRHGAGLTTDGRFGPATSNAVHNWEIAAKLSVDPGIAGPQVWASLVGVPFS